MRIKRFTAEEARAQMCRGKRKKLKILIDHLWERVNRAVKNGKFKTETDGYFYDTGGTVPTELENQGEEFIGELCQLAKEEFEKYGYNVVIDMDKDCSRSWQSFTIRINWKELTKETSDENAI